MAKHANGIPTEPRRGTEPGDEAYLRLVGERVRLMRLQMGMSRKALSQASGVSERYLAELERGSGNASLLVLRSIADALGTRVHDLTVEDDDRPIDKTLAIHHLERLSATQAAEARQILVDRFGRKPPQTVSRIAIVGMRGAGKTTVGSALARALGVPCVDLDREVERASGIEVSEVFAVHGREIFDKIQHECLANVLNSLPRGVIKTGGGIVRAKPTYDLLLAGCFVIWVRASLEDIKNAWGEGGETDDGESLDSAALQSNLEAALREREPLYALADAVVDTTDRTVDEALDRCLALIEAQAAQNEFA